MRRMEKRKKIREDAKRLANNLAKATTIYTFRNGPVKDVYAEGKFTQEDIRILGENMTERLGEIFYLLLSGRGEDIEYLLALSSFYTKERKDVNLEELEENVRIGKRFKGIREERGV